MTSDLNEILAENARRHARLASGSYDPLLGDPRSPDRRLVRRAGKLHYLPATMIADPAYSEALGNLEWERLRIRHDFEFWAARCVRISDKLTGADIPFILNRPQRRLVGALERQRLAGQPIRLILLKARQWGASTLVLVYCAWIQIVLVRNWHSLICAHVKDTSATVRGMLSKLLASYPPEFWEEDEAAALRPFERAQNTRLIAGRGCKITLCSAENQDSVRGQDISIAHLSEVAFWKDTPLHTPTELMRSLIGGIAAKPLSVVVMESTANGVGNFFHREWLRATSPAGSDKEPFFVAWHEIDIYSQPVADPAALVASMDAYERDLWTRHGCTLEAIAWYKARRREYASHRDLMAEFPSTPVEAFSSTGSNVFAVADVEQLRLGCREPLCRGEVEADPLRWVEADMGNCSVWEHPVKGGEYVVAVDIGGRSAHSDWSVASVIRCGKIPEVVAEWRGHIDHDLLAARVCALAARYNDALLVVESNTWETQSEGHGRYILDLLTSYPNLYFRNDGRRGESRPGFHTNVSTKSAVISHLISLVREGGYVERSHGAADELSQYEHLPNGSYAARSGCHDDILMSRAIGLWVATRELQPEVLPPGAADYFRLACPTIRQ